MLWHVNLKKNCAELSLRSYINSKLQDFAPPILDLVMQFFFSFSFFQINICGYLERCANPLYE